MALVRVCATDEIPSSGVLRVTVDGPDGEEVPVAVARDSDGSFHALSDTCSHQAVSLSEGEVEDGKLECWLHGSLFDLRTGRPDSLPAVTPVPVYVLAVEGTDVLVDVTASPASAQAPAPA